MKTQRPLHLEIQRHRRHYYGLIRSSYREKGQVKHTTHGRLTGMSLSALKLIQAAFRGDVVPKGSADGLRTTESREYGASRAVLWLARELGLDRAIYSRREEWVEECLAMIAGRVVYAGSKLALSQQWKNSALWELCDVEGPVDVDRHCYAAMDRLLARQKAIERTLAQRHLKEGHLVLYGIASSYFEGVYADSELMEMAFRNSKTVQLEVRPVFHKTDDRIRAHVFLCVLAYYLQWHMNQRLQPLFASDGVGKNREWTFENGLERLKAICREKIHLAGAEFHQVTVPEPDQQRILDLLKTEL